MENWIVIEAFGLFSAKATGNVAIAALTIVLVVLLAFRIGPRQRR